MPLNGKQASYLFVRVVQLKPSSQKYKADATGLDPEAVDV